MFLVCPQCEGSGLADSGHCAKCGSPGTPSIYLKIGSKLLYFDFKKMSSWEINKRRVVLKLDFTINFILYIIALLGFLFLAFYVYQTISQSQEISWPLDLISKNFWSLKSIYWRLFLVSFFLDLYLIYRLARAKEREQYVLKKVYSVSPVEEAKREQRINISSAFGEPARRLIEEAYLLAAEHHYQEITPLHLLTVLLGEPQSNLMLFRLGINPGVLTGKIKRGLERTLVTQSSEYSQGRNLTFSPAAQKVVLQAYDEVYQRGGASKVETLDLWVPLGEIPDYTKEILYDLDIESYKLRHVVLWVELERNLRREQGRRHSLSIFKSKHGMNRAMTAVETRLLNAFSQDLTLLARQGALPPALGHQREMEQIFAILQGGVRGVILVGSPGIGKQSMVQELAGRMAAEQVPEILQDRRLVSLSVAAVMAGGDPAQSAQRLYQVLYEAAHSGNIVLFIKDIHNLAGIGLKGEAGTGGMGIDHVLAQAIEGGRFLVIATTDHRNYARYLEESVLGQVLTRVEVPEPDFEETVLMLEARVPYIEGKQQVFFTYQALEKAVELTNKLIHIEHQPAKALKILQETASQVVHERGKKALVSAADVAQVVSAKVNMPLTKIEAAESEKLMHLEERIHQKYIDQDYAVSQVAAALRRARAELRDERRPIANFLFVGPTGVGKTELAKRIADIYFNSEKDIIRIDMSEFQEVASIDRLIGTASTPGLLTESVKYNPYSILLLDELEKAHPNISSLFLQVLDEGRLTSGEGEMIDFTNLIIVATSNAGTRDLQEKLQQGRSVEDLKEEFVKKDLLEYFRPEFLNRFDDVIIFQPLSVENIEEIAKLILEGIARRLAEKGITLRAMPEAVRELSRVGFDPLYGARPLRRAMQDHVQNALANFLISGQIGRRDIVYLEPGGKIRIEKAAEL